MQELDLQNSFDVLSIARRWPHADENALDLASRLRTKADIANERHSIEQAIPSVMARQRFWERLGSLGIVVVFAVAFLAAFVAFDWFSLRQPIIDYFGVVAPRAAAILAVFWWIAMLHFAGPALVARETLEAKLELLAPVVDDVGCLAAAEYIDSGRPEVLAWHEIALYDREVLYAFDAAVLKALRGVSLAARSPAEQSAAGQAAYHSLYGDTTGPRKEVTHDT